MKKKLFAALLVAGTALGFAKEAKQPVHQKINSLAKLATKKLLLQKLAW